MGRHHPFAGRRSDPESDHNGHRLALLYNLWGDWTTATGDPETPDELFSCMLDAGDAFQCTIFLLLHYNEDHEFYGYRMPI